MKIFLQTYGCQMNDRDSEFVLGQFLRNGYKLTNSPEKADVILFNTCSVRQHAEEKVWSELGRLKKINVGNARERSLQKGTENNKPIIGVIGCMAANLKDKIIERMPQVDLVVGPNDSAHIYDYVKEIQKERQQVVAVDSQIRDKSFYKNLYHSDKKHCYVNISEGCSNFCSYCVVPYVRGLHRSRPVRDILKEIKALVKDGVNSITLLGQNVNDYRAETRRLASPKASAEASAVSVHNFVGLLEVISDINGLKELSFVTSHPKDIDTRLFDLMARKKNIKKYLHLPIQSGSNRILKLMNRKYTHEEYIEIIKAFRKKVPQGVVATDVIVGYPTETEKDFNDTLDLIRKIRFDFAYIFKYSPRPHTKAEKIPDDVPLETKKKRHQILLKMQKKISKSKKIKIND